ncbi:hypothetical protein A4S05_10075 [Nostoc sp. KVJ20]|nr:hypothetical protein A4S05_10075 [Nostoc sp. KVJ20]
MDLFPRYSFHNTGFGERDFQLKKISHCFGKKGDLARGRKNLMIIFAPKNGKSVTKFIRNAFSKRVFMDILCP